MIKSLFALILIVSLQSYADEVAFPEICSTNYRLSPGLYKGDSNSYILLTRTSNGFAIGAHIRYFDTDHIILGEIQHLEDNFYQYEHANRGPLTQPKFFITEPQGQQCSFLSPRNDTTLLVQACNGYMYLVTMAPWTCDDPNNTYGLLGMKHVRKQKFTSGF